MTSFSKLLRLNLVRCLIAFVCLSLFGCSNQKNTNDVITIGASPIPHAQILEFIKPILQKEGIDLQIKEFSDYIQPNLQVSQKQLDANYFQHIPYLNQFNKSNHTDLVPLVAVHIEPMGVYVAKEDRLDKFISTHNLAMLPPSLKIGIPNDTVNEGRALMLLQNKGVVELKSGVEYPTVKDIISNKYNLQFIELDPAMLPRMLSSKQLDLAVINSNYAIPAQLNPLKDAVFIEDKKSPYVNVIVVRKDELSEPKMEKLAQIMHSPEVKQYILSTYKGAIVPAF